MARKNNKKGKKKQKFSLIGLSTFIACSDILGYDEALAYLQNGDLMNAWRAIGSRATIPNFMECEVRGMIKEGFRNNFGSCPLWQTRKRNVVLN